MTTRIDEQTYVVGVWMSAIPDVVDMLATLYRDERIQPGLILDIRWRYHAPDDGVRDPFDGRDRKSFTRWSLPTSESKAIQTANEMLEMLKSENGHFQSWHTLVRGGVDEFMAAMAKCPHSHCQAAS
jgi:hypothetical protein